VLIFLFLSLKGEQPIISSQETAGRSEALLPVPPGCGGGGSLGPGEDRLRQERRYRQGLERCLSAS